MKASLSGLCLLSALASFSNIVLLISAVRVGEEENYQTAPSSKRHRAAFPWKDYSQLPKNQYTRACEKCVENTERSQWHLRCNLNTHEEQKVYEEYVQMQGKKLDELVTNQAAHSQMLREEEMCEYPDGIPDFEDHDYLADKYKDDPAPMPPAPMPDDEIVDVDDPQEDVDASPGNPCAAKVKDAIWRKSLKFQEMKNKMGAMFNMKKKNVLCKCRAGTVVSCEGMDSGKPIRKFDASDPKYQVPGRCACVYGTEGS